MNSYLISGGLGFIGSYIVRDLVAKGHRVTVLDCQTYAADTKRLKGVLYELWEHDLTTPIVAQREFDYILHLAAETHVDNSITDPLKFVKTNVLGTAHLLEFARTQSHLKAFLYFSTDEVFGPADEDTLYKEWDRYNSGNPYSASKAGGEELVLAYGNTYKLPIIITHTMNVFGPTQHDEKFIPSTVKKILAGETVIIHADPTKTISGSRFYIYAPEVAAAVQFVLKEGSLQEKYNIVGSQEVTNLRLAEMIADILGKPLQYELVDFHSSRPGHDLRYSLDGHELASLGWRPSKTLFLGLMDTVQWYANKYSR